MLHMLIRSKHNDHEEGVVDEPALIHELHILLKLIDNLLSLSLSNLELLKALKEVLILQCGVLVHLLLQNGNVKLQDFTGVFKYLSVHSEGALDVKVEDEVIILKGLKVEGADVSLDHEVEGKGRVSALVDRQGVHT